MNTHHPVVWIVTLVFLCAAEIPIHSWKMLDETAVQATGGALSVPGFTPSGWYRATVPGTVLTTLVDNAVYPDPYYGKNAYAIPDIASAQKKYWYRAVFPIPDSYSGRRVWLHVDGINYGAELYLNGAVVGVMKGAFGSGKFDITGLAVVGGDNCIAVKISPPPHPGAYHNKTCGACGSNGGALGADNPTFHATAGWDWMPTIPDRNMGIWKKVYVRETGPLTMEYPFVKTMLRLSDTSAGCTISCRVSNPGSLPARGVLRGIIEPGSIAFERRITVNGGTVATVTLQPDDTPQLVMTNPALWWPNGYGAPNLYRCTITLESPPGILSDSAAVRFGVREITRLKAGRNLMLGVNGQKILVRGGNWGLDDAMKKNTVKRLRAQIRFHAMAHLNMIRNWVGMTDDDAFYDLCDENGIMVWDDFWLANGWDGPDPGDPVLWLSQAKEKILRHRNHPCIVIWNCRNETKPPRVLDRGLRRLCMEHDGTRIYQSSSGSGGVHSGGPYGYKQARDYHKIIRGFHTELGAPSIPVVESMRLMMDEKDLWPIGDIWGFHDFCRGHQHPESWVSAMNTLYGKASGLEDFCAKSQFLNFTTFRAMFEAAGGNFPSRVQGLMLWMSNPAWPSTVWQLYDYWLEPTAALYGVKNACEPLHIQLDRDAKEVQVVNATADQANALTAEAVIYGPAGAVQWRDSTVITAPAGRSTPCFALPAPPSVADIYFVKLLLGDDTGNRVSRNFYWLSRKKGSFASTFAGLRKQSLDVQILSSRSTPDETAVTLAVKNSSGTAPALMIRLKVLDAISGARVLPAFISNNFFCLTPGETEEITVDFNNEGAKGSPVRIAYEGWNVHQGSTEPIPSSTLGKSRMPVVPTIRPGLRSVPTYK